MNKVNVKCMWRVCWRASGTVRDVGGRGTSQGREDEQPTGSVSHEAETMCCSGCSRRMRWLGGATRRQQNTRQSEYLPAVGNTENTGRTKNTRLRRRCGREQHLTEILNIRHAGLSPASSVLWCVVMNTFTCVQRQKLKCRQSVMIGRTYHSSVLCVHVVC